MTFMAVSHVVFISWTFVVITAVGAVPRLFAGELGLPLKTFVMEDASGRGASDDELLAPDTAAAAHWIPSTPAASLSADNSPVRPPLNETTPGHILQQQVLEMKGTPEELKIQAGAVFGEDLGLGKPTVEEVIRGFDPSLSPQGTRFFGLGGGMPAAVLDLSPDTEVGLAYGQAGHRSLRDLSVIKIPPELKEGSPLVTQASQEVAQAAKNDQEVILLREKIRALTLLIEETRKQASALLCADHGADLKGEVQCRGLGCMGGRVNCSKCGATGKLPCLGCSLTGKVTCSNCGGKGKFARVLCNSCRNGQIRCSRCDAFGDVRCSNCGGTGTVTRTMWCSGCSAQRAMHQLANGGTYHPQRDYCGTCRASGRVHCGYCGGRVWLDCPHCTGGVVTPERTCSPCWGQGMVTHGTCSGTGKITCGTCRGAGKVNCVTCSGRGLVPCKVCTGLMHQRKNLNGEADRLATNATSLAGDADRLTKDAAARRARAERLCAESKGVLSQKAVLDEVQNGLDKWSKSVTRNTTRLACARHAVDSGTRIALLAERDRLYERIRFYQEALRHMESAQQLTKDELKKWGEEAEKQYQSAYDDLSKSIVELEFGLLDRHFNKRIKSLNKQLDSDLMTLINTPGGTVFKKREMQVYNELRQYVTVLEQSKKAWNDIAAAKEVHDLIKSEAPAQDKLRDSALFIMSKLKDPALQKWLMSAAKYGEDLSTYSVYGARLQKAIDMAYYATSYYQTHERIAQMDHNTDEYRKQVLSIKESMKKIFDRIHEIDCLLGDS